jgi:hypothetical protein
MYVFHSCRTTQTGKFNLQQKYIPLLSLHVSTAIVEGLDLVVYCTKGMLLDATL